ncbi:MAG: threonylcarbamoyl-AMP synthase [Burkholderiales bacterium]|nr:threonylcarbamoyl-AMP synthase [Burkholderiales bacterium]
MVQIVSAAGELQLAAAADLGARQLAAGKLVAFPTETVYGLGARADDDAAVARIFAAKGRPSDHPLIVHVAHGGDPLAAALVFAAELNPLVRRLIAACWPGPLTLIVPRRAGVGASAAGGQDSIGLRCPDHTVAQALLVAASRHGVAGVAAPSANRFGRVSPTLASHVAGEFGHLHGDDAVLVLDGGACRVGIESAIVDCTRGYPVLLRPGLWSTDELAEFAGEPLRLPDGTAPRASGTLVAHYAPRARLRLLSTADMQAALAERAQLHQAVEPVDPGRSGLAPTRLAVYSRSAAVGRDMVTRRMPDSAALAAHELFAVLRELDGPDVAAIWVEQPPADPAWDGVRDRLQRAAAAADPL